MLDKRKHVEYIKKTINTKDIQYYLTDQSRVFTIYWAVNSLKIMNDDYFYDLETKIVELVKNCLNDDGGFGGNVGYSSNILFTFHALQLLYLYDIPYYNPKTINYIINLQDQDGAFMNDKYGEKDTRFDCCAILSLHLLFIMRNHINNIEECKYFYDKCSFNINEFKIPLEDSFLSEIKFNKDLFIRHIIECYNLDGGFGQIVGSESHAAQIFCCISSLRSLGSLDIVDLDMIENFLVFRQCKNGGLSGRVDKKEDVCYSFWAYSALIMIGSDGISKEALKQFIYSCQGDNGGFSDRKDNEPDLYHLMFSLASLSLMDEKELKPIDPGFCL